MTLQELITDLKAAGANDNTLRLALTCYELGKGHGVDAEWVSRRTKHAVEQEREACAKVCDELGEHWGDYKDTAILNGDVALSNAASGEPRAAARLAAAIRARGQQ
jgi:hypothetical protein